MTVEFRDKAGRTVKPGDLIVYGHALGRCASLQYGKVLAITSQRKTAYHWDSKTKEHHSREYDHAKLKVKGVRFEDNWSGLPEGSGWRDNEVAELRAGVLEFSSRVLKVTRDQIPQLVLEALDKIEVP